MSGSALLGTCFNAFAGALQGAGQARPEWENLSETDWLGWSRAVTEGENFLASAEETNGLSARNLAARLFLWYCEGAGETARPFETLPPPQQLAWEACGRHLVNMVDYDATEHGTVAEHEAAWEEWARKKQALLGKPEQDQDQAREENHGQETARGGESRLPDAGR